MPLPCGARFEKFHRVSLANRDAIPGESKAVFLNAGRDLNPCFRFAISGRGCEKSAKNLY
jgi:hypothetical protein